MTIRGAVGASLIDHTTGRVLAALGTSGRGGSSDTTIDPVDVVCAVIQSVAHAPVVTSGSVEDVVVTTATTHHLIRPVRTRFDARLVLYLRLDRTGDNLAIARHRVRALADDLA
jgi:hypothetical protein